LTCYAEAIYCDRANLVSKYIPVDDDYSFRTTFTLHEVTLCFFSLQVVSTSVGGVPEVLPPHLIRLAEPSAKGTAVYITQHTVVLLLFS